MGHNTSEGWFSINLNDPYIIIPDAPSPSTSSSSHSLSSPSSPSSSSSSSPSSPSSPSSVTSSTPLEAGQDSQETRLNGAVILRLTKPTKIKSLSIVFSGMARTSIHFDASSIPSAKPCVHCDKNSYGCTLIECTQPFLSSDTRTPHVLPAGSHRFPFSFVVADFLPAVLSSKTININYQVTATLHQVSLLPFASRHQITKPVILLQRDELPSDDLFSTAFMRLESKGSSRLSSNVSFPCSVFPQAGTIPLMLNLTLKGNATSVTKITIEMFESVFARCATSSEDERTESLVDERLVTRQNCPIQGWPSSTTETPALIPKRLMFKVPQWPLSTWTKSEEALTLACPRTTLSKGFCHASGSYAGGDIRISHTIRVMVEVRGLSNDTESKTFEHVTAESESMVWIVGNQEYRDDDTNPPSYYRSFSTKLVEGDKIHEMDQQALEALQNDLPPSTLPPCYQESIDSRSSRSSATLNSWSDPSRMSIDQFSLGESLSESTSGSRSNRNSTGSDTYSSDLAAYTLRHSHVSSAVLAM